MYHGNCKCKVVLEQNFELKSAKKLLQKTKQVPPTHPPKTRMMRSREITL